MFLKEDSMRKYFDIRVVSMHYPFHRNNYNWFGIPVMALGGKNQKGLFRIPLYFKTWAALRKNYSKDETTIVLSIFATEAAFLASYFCKLRKLKHFCWMMGQDVKPGNLYIRLSHKGTTYLAISDHQKKLFDFNYHPKKCEVLFNGLCIHELPHYQDLNRKFDFIIAGSLIPLKRVEWVLQVVKELSGKGRVTQTLIVGDGPEKKSLQKKAEQLNINNCVNFTGEVPQLTLVHYMMQSKILLHPSAFEGFANVWLEALYAGCFVVALFDPFHGTEQQFHRVHVYETFYKKAEQLLDDELIHKSVQKYTTKYSAEQFISYCEKNQ